MKTITLFCGLWVLLMPFRGLAAPPDWSVSENSFTRQASMVGELYLDEVPQGSDNLVAAFVGGDVRGVAAAVPVGNQWLYFMTLYANTNGETITFKAYIDSLDQVVTIEETVIFTGGAEYGDLAEPFLWHAGDQSPQVGNIPDQTREIGNEWVVNAANFDRQTSIIGELYLNGVAEADGNNRVAAVVDGEIRGTAQAEFYIDRWLFFMDIYANTEGETVTFKAYIAALDRVVAISETIIFDSSTAIGGTFDPFLWHADDQELPIFDSFDLDDYLTEFDGDPVNWSVSGHTELVVTIDPDNIVTINPPNASWLGSETLIFTATDGTPAQKSDADTAQFSIVPVDHPPQIMQIPQQQIGRYGEFEPIPLDNYLIEVDGDSIDWSYQFIPTPNLYPPPNWSINPNDFSLTMNMIIHVQAHGRDVTPNEGLIGAFVGGEVRGVQFDMVNGGEVGWLYFLTVYANTEGELVEFRFYDTPVNDSLLINDTVIFNSSETYGTVDEPLVFTAGHFSLTIDDQNVATLNVINPEWAGFVGLMFFAQDVGTLHEYQAETFWGFNVDWFYEPIVSDIPNQTVEQGTPFAVIPLDNYVQEFDDDPILWSAEGNTDLQVSINGQNEATITPPDTNWTGSETVRFIATENTFLRYADDDEATFTILPRDNPPQVTSIADQTIIAETDTFSVFDLDDHLIEMDNDTVVWAFQPQIQPQGEPLPDWVVNAGNFSFRQDVTIRVESFGRTTAGAGHRLAAFIGDEIRGLAAPTRSGQFGWLYYLSVYANQSGETVHFRFYDAEAQTVFPVADSISFTTGILGSPTAPVELQAGNLDISIDDQHRVYLNLSDPDWRGVLPIQFTAQDSGTLHGYRDSTLATFTVLGNMNFVSSTIDQPETTAVYRHQADQLIAAIPVVMADTEAPLSVTQFDFSTGGSTDPATDIEHARLYHTLTDTFSTDHLFGEFESPNGNFSITGSEQLQEGINYFWLTYSIPSDATPGNIVDAEYTAVTIGGNSETPQTTSVEGRREVSPIQATTRRGTLADGQTQIFEIDDQPSAQTQWNQSSGTLPTDLAVFVVPDQPYNFEVINALPRYWMFHATGGSSGWQAVTRLYYPESDLNGFDEETLAIWSTDDGGLSWTEVIITQRNTTENWLEGDVSAFSEFIITDGNAPTRPQIDVDSLGIELSVNWDQNGVDTLTVTNSGDGPLVFQIFEDIDWLDLSRSADTLDPSQAVPIQVMVDATQLSIGTHQDTLHIHSNDPNTPTVEVSISITVTTPELQVDVDHVNFGAQRLYSPVDTTITITNTGDGMLTMTIQELAGNNSNQFQLVTGVETVLLNPSESYPMTLRFLPTSAGEKQAQITLVSNDPEASEQVIHLIGTGTYDLTGDLILDDRDLQLLMDNWGDPGYDLTGDGKVTVEDIQLLVTRIAP